MSKLSVAATQMACSWDLPANLERAEKLIHDFDMEAIRNYRYGWGLFRDRRPDLYQTIATLDGVQR